MNVGLSEVDATPVVERVPKMIHSRNPAPSKAVLAVRFFRESSGNEPVREWLQALPAEERSMKRNPHVGSTLDDFLREDGSYDAVQAIAVKRVLAFQLEESMRKARLTKSEMARRMRTTRAQLDRLLDPDNPSTTLQTLVKAAGALGKRLNISLVKG